MYKNKRCYDRPMSYSNETSFKYQDGMNTIEYPEAMPKDAIMQPMGGHQYGAYPMMSMNCMMPPIYECPQERICHKEFIHEVPHVCPINTRIINHHIYKHTYTPCYTSCEENEICNVYDGCCNQF